MVMARMGIPPMSMAGLIMLMADQHQADQRGSEDEAQGTHHKVNHRGFLNQQIMPNGHNPKIHQGPAPKSQQCTQNAWRDVCERDD